MQYNLRVSSDIFSFNIGGPGITLPSLTEPLLTTSSFKETKKMNMLTMIMGLLVGLVAPILLGVAMAAAKIISIGRDALTINSHSSFPKSRGAEQVPSPIQPQVASFFDFLPPVAH